LALAAAADTNESALALSLTAVTLTKREFNGAVAKDKVVGAVLVNAQDKIGATSSAPSLSGPKTTLNVCLLSVMSNWEDQIKAHTNGSLKVARYHGAKRAWMTPAFLSEKDVMITTYGTLHSEWE
jgi:SWI/SNF-related matrix-associated actin-dependent regulator of chromatin subfamily A3